MLPYQGEWMVYSDQHLLKLAEMGQSEEADQLRQLQQEYELNKMAYFLSHGGGTDFINDRETDFSILFAPNRAGKTYHGGMWILSRLIPMDPDWPCFNKTGLIHYEWQGPKAGVVCSYTISNHLRAVLAPMLFELLPEHELKEYAPTYKGKGRKKINWVGEMQLPLGCGSSITFRAYQQDQVAFESAQFKVCLCDEQPPLAKIDGLIERGRTGMDKSLYAACATPHSVKGWPETGSAGPLARMLKGQLDLGITTKEYNISIDDIPTCIYPDSEKRKAYIRWVESPKKRGDRAQIREGQARYYGLPQSSDGLVIDQFEREVHVIKAFDPPKDWTRYRSMDPGTVNPSAASWGAVCPKGFLYIYREHKAVHPTPGEFAKKVVELSGNERSLIDEIGDEFGVTKVYEETFIEEHYSSSVLDSRSFGQRSNRDCNLGDMYNDLGMYCERASGAHDATMVPMMNEWFRVDPELKNPVTGEMGSPKIFIMDCCMDMVLELEQIIHRASTGNTNDSEDIKKKDDHLFDTLKYKIACQPTYMGDRAGDKYDRPKNTTNDFTGY